MKALILLLSTLVVAPAVVAPALAQTYPAKPIRILIAQAPGSATDVISRVVANRLQEFLGQPVIIEAKPGAGGGALPPRRVHALHGEQFDPRLEPRGVREASLRRGRGLRADLLRRLGPLRAGGQPVAAGEVGPGADRGGEGP